MFLFSDNQPHCRNLPLVKNIFAKSQSFFRFFIRKVRMNPVTGVSIAELILLLSITEKACNIKLAKIATYRYFE